MTNAYVLTYDGKCVISCGHWDDSFKVRAGRGLRSQLAGVELMR